MQSASNEPIRYVDRVAYVLMYEYLNIYSDDPENWNRTPKAIFHSLEAAYQRMEEESRKIDPHNRIRRPCTARELEEAGGVLKGY
jgi:hypothetical protein